MGFNSGFKGLTGKRRIRISLQNENSPSLSAFYNGFKVELNLNKSNLHSFFWEIPRSLNFMCRRFGTLCSIFISGVRLFIEKKGFGSKIFLTASTRLFFLPTPPMKMEQSVPKRRHIKLRHGGIT